MIAAHLSETPTPLTTRNAEVSASLDDRVQRCMAKDAPTRRRDHEQKRGFYLRIGVAEYWMVDRWSRSIRVVRRAAEDVVAESVLEWATGWRARGALHRRGGVL